MDLSLKKSREQVFKYHYTVIHLNTFRLTMYSCMYYKSYVVRIWTIDFNIDFMLYPCDVVIIYIIKRVNPQCVCVCVCVWVCACVSELLLDALNYPNETFRSGAEWCGSCPYLYFVTLVQRSRSPQPL